MMRVRSSAVEVEAAPRHEDVAVRGSIAIVAPWLTRSAASADADRRAPRVAAIGRAREHHDRSGRPRRRCDQRVGDVDGAGRARFCVIGPFFVVGVAIVQSRRCRAGCPPPSTACRGTLPVAPPGSRLQRARAEIGDRVASFLVVVVDEARDEDGALAGLGVAGSSIEDEAVVVDQPVGAGAHDRVGAGLVALDRRGRARGARCPADSRAAACSSSAVRRRTTCRGRATRRRFRRHAGKPGQIDGAVVVRSGEQVQRIARRGRDRRLVLPLQERIAVRPPGARHHVDVAARDLRLNGRHRQPDGEGKAQGQANEHMNDAIRGGNRRMNRLQS